MADSKLGRIITYNYTPLDQIASTTSVPVDEEVIGNILGVGSTGSGSAYYTRDTAGDLLAERNSTSNHLRGRGFERS